MAQAIADTGFSGYIAHEYSPAPGRDPLQSLEQAMKICEVCGQARTGTLITPATDPRANAFRPE